MYDKLIEIFYYIIPGGTLLSVTLYYYWDNLINKSFVKYLTDHSSVFIVFLIISAFAFGLLIEGLGKLVIKDWITEKLIKSKFKEENKILPYIKFGLFKYDEVKKFKTIRKLIFCNRKELREYFASRSAFFRHFVIVFILIGFIVYNKGNLNLLNLMLLLSLALLNYAFHLYYTDKENRTTISYSGDEYFINFKEK